jgi:phage terminase large subunit
VYYPYYLNDSRYLVLYGGAGSGKSVFTAQKIIFRMLTETPHKFLVVRKVAKTLRESTFSLLRTTIADWGMEKLFTLNKSEMSITCVNGNQIIHAGLDDVEKLKSIHNVTSIWVEECSELEEGDLQQLDLRLRGKTRNYKQFILSFNPISITHWLKLRFFDREVKNATTLKTTYLDNKFLDDEYIETLLALKDTDYYYYSVYALGEWGVTGTTVFNARIVTERLVEVRDKLCRRGSFVYRYEDEQIVDESIEFVEDGTGPVTIYEMPKKGYPYVLGGDIAEGGIDYSVGEVRNNATWNQAAEWRGHMDTDLYAKQMYCMGKFYNTALIGIETNFDTHPVKELERLRYPRQYMREVVDKITNTLELRHGFVTTKITRPIIISKYVAMAREHIDTWNDPVNLEEMLTFTRDEKGKPQAEEGGHDDTVLAGAITLGIREQQSFEIDEEPQEKQQRLADKMGWNKRR